MFHIVTNGMEIIWGTVLSTLVLFFFLRYFQNIPPSPFFILVSLSLILFLFIIDRNRSVYEETKDIYALYTFEEEDIMLGGDIIDKEKNCSNLTRYYHDDDDDYFSYYHGYHEVDPDGDLWNVDEDCSQWNQDDGDDGTENHDDDDDHAYGNEDDDDDDRLTSRIEDYIANVYNGWREERRAENLLV